MAANSENSDMMDIGEHCSFSNCHRIDFLPIKCRNCDYIFCKEHSALDAHQCTAPPKQAAETKIQLSGPTSFQCSLAVCEQRELTEIVCDACSKVFCLKHRHQVDHQCENLTQQEERMCKTRQHIESLEAVRKPASKPAGRGRKSKATAAKVMLMKIKMKAVGDKGLPDTERIYLQILLPSVAKEKSKPMFFSQKWSVGRVIDVIANTCGLVNNNNIAGKQKLRLFDGDVGDAFEMTKSLGELLSDDQVVSGGTVVIEYVDENVQTLDVSSYSN